MRSALRDRSTQSLCKSEQLFSQSPGRVDSSGFADKNQAFHSRGDCGSQYVAESIRLVVE